jgi:hypothetical protein
VRAQAHAPSDAELLFQMSTLENNAGHVLEGRGRLDEATTDYRRMLSAAQLLVDSSPKYAGGRPQLGLAHNNLAKMALLHGDVAGAVAGYRADVAIQGQLAAADPRDNAQAERLVLSRGALGRTLALAGALDEGAQVLQQAFDGAQRLHAMEPDSASFHEDVGLYATQLARQRRQQGSLPAAQAATAQSLEMFATLVARDASNPGWQRSQAEARIEQARQALASAQPAVARSALDAAVAAVQPQLAASPQDRAALLALVEARLLLAGLDGPAASRAALEDALAACDAQKDGQRDPRLRALRAELLLALGREADAVAMAQDLWRSGYRDAAFALAMQGHALLPSNAPVASRGAP